MRLSATSLKVPRRDGVKLKPCPRGQAGPRTTLLAPPTRLSTLTGGTWTTMDET